MYGNEKPVNGVAKVGDRVRFYNMNSRGNRIYVVKRVPNEESFMYVMQREDEPDYPYPSVADLQSDDWSFAEDEVPAVAVRQYPAEFFKR